ncbi:MAG: YdiU family protein [Pseudomonadota bacterium]
MNDPTAATANAAPGGLPVIPFDNSYAMLPDSFHVKMPPTPVATPRLIKVNHDVAAFLGLDTDALETDKGAALFAGNLVPQGAEPLAMAYAGHQFGGWSPQLGDGRAILLGEVRGADGHRYDIQLKGSGPTPFSRMGDGRAALGPVLREYIVSEAMHALGVPTTRALAAATTGELVRRETMLPGAVFTRVSRGHVRVGTFQYFTARQDTDAVRTLADYVIDRLYPEISGSGEPYVDLLSAVIEKQANLIAQWLNLGFIHGVMNTDNMSIAGETIDYGPCAFMDSFHPQRVYSSIDEMGRYAYGNQPRIGHWNLVNLAQCLLPLLADDKDDSVKIAQERVDVFPDLFRVAHVDGLRAKIGLATEDADDEVLADTLLKVMADADADFTLTFRALSTLETEAGDDGPFLSLFSAPENATEWLAQWRMRLAGETRSDTERHAAMRAANPAFIPRNHRVEQALVAAQTGDFAPFERLVSVLARPFEDQLDADNLKTPPLPEEVVPATFCGT